MALNPIVFTEKIYALNNRPHLSPQYVRSVTANPGEE